MFLGVFPASIAGLLFLLAFMAFIGVLFGSLAVIVTSFAPNFDFFNYYTELFITPMLFFSGVFFPLDRFPAWMNVFAQFLPLTHAVNIARAAFSGDVPANAALDSLYLIILGAAAFFTGIRLMKRRLIK